MIKRKISNKIVIWMFLLMTLSGLSVIYSTAITVKDNALNDTMLVKLMVSKL